MQLDLGLPKIFCQQNTLNAVAGKSWVRITETMRLLRIATTFVTTASSSQLATPSLARSVSSFPSRHHRRHHTSSGPSLSSLLSLTLLGVARHRTDPPRGAPSAATFAAAAEGGDDEKGDGRPATTAVADNDEQSGECNATATIMADDIVPPLSELYDPEYPGTSVRRMRSVRERVAILASDGTLDGPWESVRRRLLWAGGLRDLPDAAPGMGYTGHSFNDYNHVDLTTMNDDVSDNLNDGSVKGIAIGNRLGPGVRVATIPELGPGGSWSTCAIGCASDPPRDVAHIQFRSRIAFKLVWVPNGGYDAFVLVDDDGGLLAHGRPSGGALPSRREREMNYRIMMGSKYAAAAERLATSGGNSTAMT